MRLDISDKAAEVAELMGEDVRAGGIWNAYYHIHYPFYLDMVLHSLAYRALKEIANYESDTFSDSDIATLASGPTEAIFDAYIEWKKE